MSSFTPRGWKSQAEPRAEHPAAPPIESPARADIRTNNLPIAATAFIGRERDVADIKALLDKHRLVTLVGSGGIGKTRLAIQVGSELLGSFADGVWLVDLAPIADPELVSSVIAQTLGMSQQEGRRVDESIPAWLERKQLLLILDNCEHVLETIAPITAAILRTAPSIRILATSRQSFAIGGEEVMRIPSLDVPRSIADLSAAKVVEFGAVALFVARATSADKSFTLTDDTAPIVADICRRLDGIALAIELAAARVKVLSIPHLAERLNERFKLLTGNSRDALPRQKTLHALLDWSYDLLTPQEQLLFARLGIFAGGFALDAATLVCGGEGLDELDVLDLLGSLADKSLVVADTSDEHERYRLLESTAAYAMEKLRDSGEHDALARRHAEYYSTLAQDADERCGTVLISTLVEGLRLELDNFRSALAWALTQGHDAGLGGTLAGALGYFWNKTSLRVEGRYWIERALEAINEREQPGIVAGLQRGLCSLSSGKRKRDAAERAMRLYADVGDARRAGDSQSHLAFALYQMGELDAAQAENEQALATLRACGNAGLVADCLNTQAIIDLARGNVGAAREGFTEALAAHKALENDAGTSLVLSNIAELEFGDGHPELALRAGSEALQISLGGKASHRSVIAYINGAAYRLALDDLAGSGQWAREGLRIARQARMEMMIPIALQHLALLAARGGDERRAAQVLGYVDARYAEFGLKREVTEQWGHDKLLAALREALSEDEIARLSADGATWSEDRAVEQASHAAIEPS